MKYNPDIVTAFFAEYGIPTPVFELRFAPPRRWRFDLCWPEFKIALEVQGGIFVNGRHSRGAALLKEWEKLNTAAVLGWRIIYCQPKYLCTEKTAYFIRSAIIKK